MRRLSGLVFRVNAGDVSTKSAGKHPERSFLPWIRRELFFRLKKSGGSPKQRHVGIAIAANATADMPHGAILVLDDVGLAQAPRQRGSQLRAAHREGSGSLNFSTVTFPICLWRKAAMLSTPAEYLIRYSIVCS